eukprot:6200380-Lingulodinium_polyedra.AAC.1
MVVDAWSARIAKCTASQRLRACPDAFLSGSRARAPQTRVQKRIPLLRCRTVRDVCTPRVDYHIVLDAWNA